MKAFQDYYPDEPGPCLGCGRNNERGRGSETEDL
jgi:hypothetical protein